jgi:hypothetical protein
MQKTTNYFTIQFNDLSKEKQEDIKKSLYKGLLENNKEYLFKYCGDPYKVSEHLAGCIERACDQSWCEMGVDSTL